MVGSDQKVYAAHGKGRGMANTHLANGLFENNNTLRPVSDFKIPVSDGGENDAF